jgi:hypothetical protein
MTKRKSKSTRAEVVLVCAPERVSDNLYYVAPAASLQSCD